MFPCLRNSFRKRRGRPPTAPSNLSASTDWTTGGAVSLTWTDNSSNETAFVIEKSTDNVTFTEHGTAAAGATSYQVTGLTNDTLYYFRLKARAGGYNSSATDVASATPRIKPTDVAGSKLWFKADSITASNGDSIGSWTDSSATGLSVTATGSNRPTYVASWRNGKPALDFDGSDDFFSSGANTFTMSSRCTGFVVAELDTVGGLFFENPASAGGTTGWYMGAISGDLAIYVRRSGTGEGILWSSASTWGTTGAKVRAATYTDSGPKYYVNGVEKTGDGLFGSGQQSQSDSTKSIVIGARSGSQFQVNGRIAEIILYDGVLSAADIQFVTHYLQAKYDMFAPLAPTGLTATTNYTAAGAVSLSWTARSGNETAFKIEKSTDNVTFTEHATTSDASTTYLVTGLSDDTLYYFRVKAVNAYGTSDASSTASATARALPSSISGLRLWLKSDTGVSKTGSSVDSWADQSGNGYSATSSSTARPTQDGTVTLNGYSAVVWDGNNDSMSIASLPLTGYQTWFGVLKQDVNKLMIEHSATSNSNPGHYIYGDGNYSVQVNRGGTFHRLDKASWLGTSNAYFIARWNGSTIELWVNGTQQVGGTLSGSDPGNGTVTDTLFIGSRNAAEFFSNLRVWELGVYDGYISDSDKTKLQNSLAGKYGL